VSQRLRFIESSAAIPRGRHSAHSTSVDLGREPRARSTSTVNSLFAMSSRNNNYERLEGGMGPARPGAGKKLQWKKLAIACTTLIALVWFLSPRGDGGDGLLPGKSSPAVPLLLQTHLPSQTMYIHSTRQRALTRTYTLLILPRLPSFLLYHQLLTHRLSQHPQRQTQIRSRQYTVQCHTHPRPRLCNTPS